MDTKRKDEWRAKQPKVYVQQTEEQIQKQRDRAARRRQRGAAKHADQRQDIAWQAEEGVDLSRLVRVAIPFEFALSKNAMWSMARGANYVFASAQHKKVRASVESLLRHAIERDGRFFNGKIWIDILVQKPSHRGDAVNMIDGICDAVKTAIGVDDNWFCIRKVDWEIVKDNPQIYIGVGQEITEDHQACSYCGRILAITCFPVRKRLKFGHGRVCIDCDRDDESVRRSLRRRKGMSLEGGLPLL